MTIHSDSFTVHADYLTTGLLGLPYWIWVAFAAAALFMAIGILGRALPVPRAVTAVTSWMGIGVGVLTAFGMFFLIIIIPYDINAPSIQNTIDTPQDCVIDASLRPLRPKDRSVATLNLPEGHTRATYTVTASCTDHKALEQLLKLDGAIITLGQQPFDPATHDKE